MNNWRVIGYIFLGFGSVFLIYGLLQFFILAPETSFSSLLSVLLISPYMLFALLAYVVGVIGYFVGRDSDASIVTNKPKTKKAQNPRVSDKMNSWWSFTIGALATLGAIVVLLVMGFLNTSDMVYGVFIPTFLSIVAGSISGLAALAIIDKINES